MASSTEGSTLQVKLLGTSSAARRNPLQEGDRDAKGSCGETELMQRNILRHERHREASQERFVLKMDWSPERLMLICVLIDSVFSFRSPFLKTGCGVMGCRGFTLARCQAPTKAAHSSSSATAGQKRDDLMKSS